MRYFRYRWGLERTVKEILTVNSSCRTIATFYVDVDRDSKESRMTWDYSGMSSTHKPQPNNNQPTNRQRRRRNRLESKRCDWHIFFPFPFEIQLVYLVTVVMPLHDGKETKRNKSNPSYIPQWIWECSYLLLLLLLLLMMLVHRCWCFQPRRRGPSHTLLEDPQSGGTE